MNIKSLLRYGSRVRDAKDEYSKFQDVVYNEQLLGIPNPFSVMIKSGNGKGASGKVYKVYNYTLHPYKALGADFDINGGKTLEGKYFAKIEGDGFSKSTKVYKKTGMALQDDYTKLFRAFRDFVDKSFDFPMPVSNIQVKGGF